jgi:predicted enzyme related to lactoylglutathione lyase
MDLTDARLVANIPARDIGRAMQWYEEKLGLKRMMDLGVAGQLYQTGGVFWLMYETSAAGTGKHTVASWVVPSIEDAVRDLRAKGVEFEEYDMGEQGPTTQDGVARGPDGGASAWFKDSEDNVLAITELPPGMDFPAGGS